MSKVDAFYDSSSGYLGGSEVHPEKWRVHGNEAQMVDTSKSGPLSPARDDDGVNTCERKKGGLWPKAPGFKGEEDTTCGSGKLSGAFDGAERIKNPNNRS